MTPVMQRLIYFPSAGENTRLLRENREWDFFLLTPQQRSTDADLFFFYSCRLSSASCRWSSPSSPSWGPGWSRPCPLARKLRPVQSSSEALKVKSPVLNELLLNSFSPVSVQFGEVLRHLQKPRSFPLQVSSQQPLAHRRRHILDVKHAQVSHQRTTCDL